MVLDGSSGGAAPQQIIQPKPDSKDQKKSAVLPTQGTVVVHLPADAELYVDGTEVNLTSDTRTLVTPELIPNQDYYYTLQARVERDGKPVTASKRVTVRAGREVAVDFGNLERSAPVTARAHVTVRLPADARLYVNGDPCPLKSAKRSFDTPPLEAGRSYYYTLRVEYTRDGRPVSATRRVTVEAGKDVAVNFNRAEATTTAQR